MTKVHSYHTFILPLIWKGGNKKLNSLDNFAACFESNPFWERTDPKDKNSFGSEDTESAFYSEYQYFYPQVRNAFYGYYDDIVKTFTFSPKHVQNKAHYYITKKGRTYDLLINAVKLKIYNTGVALFILECENHGMGKDGKEQTAFGDIKNINDYGRRITLPFLPKNSDHSICADKLELEIKELDLSFTSDFRAFIEQVNSSESKATTIRLDYLSSIIKGILSYNCSYRFSSEFVSGKDRIYIRPAIDDRMFVACLVGDKSTTDAMLPKAKDKKGKEIDDTRLRAFEEDDALAKSLYEFLFVDPHESCTCQSKKLRDRLLEEHLYDRWFDSGSIYGITAHSLILLFNGDFEPIIGSFLNIYVKMVCLCLVQKASLIYLQQETGELSANVYKSKINAGAVTRLMDLQERFSAFESQLLFTEVTPEEQGIELYEMISKFFFIDDNVENVKSQLQGLNEAVDTDFNYDLNKIAYFLTIIGAAFGIAGLFSEKIVELYGILLTLAVSLGFCAATYIVICLLYRRRK